jgi:myo-inositol-1(or 4)-monophosphatase
MYRLEDLCKDVTLITAETGKFILNERKNFKSSSIEKKGHNDLVSYVDKTAEKMIVEGLLKILPEAGFITEEKTSEVKGAEYNWIIDPLDGTTNFIHGLPCFCISIALMKDKEIILGVVHELNFDECFYGFKDGGAFLNGRKISVSDTKSLSESLMATGFPYHNYDRMKPYMEIFDYCMHNTHGLRRLGSAAADLAYVACGRFEGFYEYGLNSWDVAGGALIVKEAGGVVTDFKGGTDFIFGAEIIATNAFIAEEFSEIVKNKFSNSH